MSGNLFSDSVAILKLTVRRCSCGPWGQKVTSLTRVDKLTVSCLWAKKDATFESGDLVLLFGGDGQRKLGKERGLLTEMVRPDGRVGKAVACPFGSRRKSEHMGGGPGGETAPEVNSDKW